MKEIELTQGKVAIVDDGDYEKVSQYKWSALKVGNRFYAHAWINGRVVLMHRLILGLTDKKIQGDHVDGDGLNNRRGNIRPATQAQNLANRRKFHKNLSMFKGVHRDRNRWRAQVTVNGKTFRSKRFRREIDAARAYNEMAKKYFGEFARLNNVSEITLPDAAKVASLELHDLVSMCSRISDKRPVAIIREAIVNICMGLDAAIAKTEGGAK